jgi:hypothetical protein
MTRVKTLDAAERGKLDRLLNRESAADAMAAYYALNHPAEKTSIYVHEAAGGGMNGFLIVAQTGMDLFHPVVVPFVARGSILRELLLHAIHPGRPFVLFLPHEQRDWLPKSIEQRASKVYELLRLDRNSFEPIINVLVVEVATPNKFPRYEIRSRSGAFAASGVNWKGDRFAEIYLEADSEAAGRKFAISVLAAMSAYLIEENRIPLLRWDDQEGVSLESLRGVGYRPTGSKILTSIAALRSDDEMGMGRAS